MEAEKGIFYIHPTIMNSEEWKAMEEREFQHGPEALLDELLAQSRWSNAEMAWVIRRMVYYYGRKDELLKKVPPERMMANMSAILRCLFLLLDYTNSDLDDNIRGYLTAKLVDASWGINTRTREYLVKFKE
ncbi:MAG: hypothetical protein Q4B48_00875 [Syntrophomonadaceae bacterium]|nr:hypothetical protein [Syntrophomonadaceae bacterium]